MRKLLVALTLAAAAASAAPAQAAVISYSTTGDGLHVLFSGTPEQSQLNFLGCPGGFFTCKSSVDLAFDTATVSATHILKLAEIGTNDNVFPLLNTTFDIATVFTIAGKSLTLTQAVTFQQAANSQFFLRILASDTGTIDLGATGLLDITARGITANLRPENTGGTFTLSSTFLLRPAAAAPGVPEPASWAMMIGGFALAGAALRRRRAPGRATAAAA